MTFRNDLKIWIRSGSWEFAWGRKADTTRQDLSVYRWKGIPIHYRPSTTDKGAIYTILVRPGKKAEYHVPANIKADVILDIGGHIGTAAIFLANRFPNARIYSFEPVPDNFELLTRNVARLPNVQGFPIALGSAEATRDIYACEDSVNLGGYSLFERATDGLNAGTDASRKVKVNVRPLPDVLSELAVNKIDIIKIDTEGSEFDILTSIPSAMLSGVQWIMGELHGVRDFELLAYLSRWFDLKVQKKMDSDLFLFHARNKALKRGHE